MDVDRLVLIAVSAGLALGCSTVTPASFRAKAPDLSQQWSGDVSVTPGYAVDPLSRFNANGVTFDVNLDQFSEQLAELVAESLAKSGATIGPSDRTMEIQVVYLDFLFQGPCLVDYSVRLGNGDVFGQQAAAPSKIFTTACARALEQAVQEILRDSRTITYLGGD